MFNSFVRMSNEAGSRGRRFLARGVAGLLGALFLCSGSLGDEPKGNKEPTDVEEGFVSLFDGKSFDGWEGNLEVFRIQDRAIAAGSPTTKIARNEFLCTRKEYENFELRLQAKLTGKGDNAGIQFRSKRVPNHHEVSGYQCDMGSSQGKFIWGALYDESRRNRFLVQVKEEEVRQVLKVNDWNDITIHCEGDRIRLFVNGVMTVDFQEMDSSIARRGVLGLQIHGGEPAEASYRNIRIRELKAKS